MPPARRRALAPPSAAGGMEKGCAPSMQLSVATTLTARKFCASIARESVGRHRAVSTGAAGALDAQPSPKGCPAAPIALRKFWKL